MKYPICIIQNDKFTISFKTTNQMFYHLYRLLSQYGDEIDLELIFDNKSKSIIITNETEVINEQD